MSRKERDRLKVIEQIDQRRLTQAQAAQLLGLSERQVRRIVRRWREQGDGGLVHRSRGRTAANHIPTDRRERAMALARADYVECAPTFVTEHLAADHGLVFSHETVRGWMIEERLWQPAARHGGHRRHRPRRECFGEMVQMDTSIHDWLEGRGESMVLILMIDDASSRVLMRFYGGDTTEANMDLMARWIARHGRPRALYVDYASHFRQLGRRGSVLTKRTHTQIERALDQLQIRMINAHSPQAKGRVERAFQTLQDRLVKELRLLKIRTMAQANRYLDEHFIAWWESRLSVAPACAVDAHGSAAGLDLDAILCVQETRRVGKDATIRWGGSLYQLTCAGNATGLTGARVTVERRRGDGGLRVRWREDYLGIEKIHRINPEVAATAPVEAGEATVGLRPPCASPASTGLKLPHQPKPPAKDHPWRKRTLSLCPK